VSGSHDTPVDVVGAGSTAAPRAVAGGAGIGVPPRRALVVAVLVAATITVVALLWSKWLPYAERIGQLAVTGTWSGADILTAGGVRPGDPPSWAAATSFTGAYAAAVWKALVAALLISCALQALVPRSWLLRVLDRPRPLGSAAVGGLLSTPSMMCTCCTAPVAVGLRRSGVPTSAVVAYWLGNPLLNPAVLVFLALVAPWQWTLTRAAVGLVVVVGGGALVGWLIERRGLDPTTGGPTQVPDRMLPPAGSDGTGPDRLRGAPRRFGRALLRTGVVLVPEYLVVVMLVGAFRGWLLGLGPQGGAVVTAGFLAVVLAAVVGTLLVVPTGGEIPVLQGLALLGASTGVVGALLVTLPAVSLPGIVMVGRALGWRATAATTVLVIVAGVAAAGLLVLL
jgi:uncharacterized membrane protein YraQ (UPF0718 family)